MSQQTINVGASPNDGTGTPLRTAFQYTNSNFSELYTATGPSGNNITVPGTATITGDLTVDTSTLKVDSTNNRVGIGTASPTVAFDVVGSAKITGPGDTLTLDKAGAASLKINTSGNIGTILSTTGNGGLLVYTANGIGGAADVRYKIDDTGIATWSNVGGVAGTAMTLNSIGLGVGIVPSSFGRFSVQGTAVSAGILGMNTDATRSDIQSYNVPLALNRAGNNITMCEGGGNVGIGVTPSAWATSGNYRAFQVGNVGIYGRTSASANNELTLSSNGFYGSSGWTYITTAAATKYEQQSGAHQWYNAASGTAGNAITFTQAMTLNANGALALQGGNTSANGIGIAFPAAQSASSDANTLDDYEEGTFAPTIGGTATYTAQTGRYVKIGNRVFVTIRIIVNIAGTGDDFKISGLPFVVATTISPIFIGYFANLKISVNYISGYANSGTSTILMTATTAASANITNGAAVIGNSSDLAISCFYEV